MEFRFSCQPGCTDCCRGKGFVYMTEDDVVRAAGFLGMTAEAFEKRYVYRTTHQRRLRAPRDVRCPFLREDGCAIHAAKPTQCRLFPFWPEVIASARAWYGTASRCRGIGKGDLVQIETAHKLADEMRVAYPRMYRD